MGKPVNKTLRIAAMSAGEEIGHVSGPIVTFRGNGDPLRSLLVNIEPVQAGSGDPSPDNVRPISGWSAVNMWRTGKNLLNSSIVHGIWTIESWYSHEGYNTKYLSTQYAVPVVGGKTYCFSLKNDSNNPAVSGSFIAFANGDAISEAATWFNIANGIINVPSGADSIVINIILTNNIESTFDVSATDFQLELGSTATPYEPYSGNQYTIRLGQTVYGGALDVINGVLTVNRAEVDLGTLSWGEGVDRFSSNSIRNSIFRQSAWGTANPIAKCSCYKYGSVVVGSSADKVVGVYDGTVYVRDTTYSISDIQSFVTAMSGVQLVYELATPITIPLTPTQITTLQGQNNVWADSGDVTVEYIATGGEGGKLALLLRNRKELLIALRKGLSPAEVGLLGSIPSFGGSLSPGVIRPGLNTQEEEEDEKDDA